MNWHEFWQGLLEVLLIVEALLLAVLLLQIAWYGRHSLRLLIAPLATVAIWLVTAQLWFRLTLHRDVNDPGRHVKLLTDPWYRLYGLYALQNWLLAILVAAFLVGFLAVAARVVRRFPRAFGFIRTLAWAAMAFVALVAAIGVDYQDPVAHFKAAFSSSHQEPDTSQSQQDDCKQNGDPQGTLLQNIMAANKQHASPTSPYDDKVAANRVDEDRKALDNLPQCKTEPAATLGFTISKVTKVGKGLNALYKVRLKPKGTAHLSTWNGDAAKIGFIVEDPDRGSGPPVWNGSDPVDYYFHDCGYNDPVKVTQVGVGVNGDVASKVEKQVSVKC